MPLIKMAQFGTKPLGASRPPNAIIFMKRATALLRMITATANAVARGAVNAAIGRVERGHAQLLPGDPAPEFSLTASDGHTYSLRDFRGHQAVVLAWFPKAFTAG